MTLSQDITKGCIDCFVHFGSPKGLIFITTGRDRSRPAVNNQSRSLPEKVGLKAQSKILPFQVVYTCTLLPQVATCGYENQALRAARCTKSYCTKKNYILETKFDAVNTINAIEVYDKIPHFNSPSGDKYQ
jgi:hypothetical protein